MAGEALQAGVAAWVPLLLRAEGRQVRRPPATCQPIMRLFLGTGRGGGVPSSLQEAARSREDPDACALIPSIPGPGTLPAAPLAPTSTMSALGPPASPRGAPPLTPQGWKEGSVFGLSSLWGRRPDTPHDGPGTGLLSSWIHGNPPLFGGTPVRRVRTHFSQTAGLLIYLLNNVSR